MSTEKFDEERERKVFEDRAYQHYVVQCALSKINLKPTLVEKMQFCERVQDGNYRNPMMAAAWWAWSERATDQAVYANKNAEDAFLLPLVKTSADNYRRLILDVDQSLGLLQHSMMSNTSSQEFRALYDIRKIIEHRLPRCMIPAVKS